MKRTSVAWPWGRGSTAGGCTRTTNPSPGRRAIWLLLVVILSLLPQAVAGAEWEEGGWRTSATASSIQTRGSAVSIRASVTANAVARALVDVEIYGPDGRRVGLRYWDGGTFRPGVAREFQWTFALASNALSGNYTVTVGVFKPGWGVVYHWNDEAAVFGVGTSQPPATTTTSLPVTTTTAPIPTTTTTAPVTTTRRRGRRRRPRPRRSRCRRRRCRITGRCTWRVRVSVT
jgi:hypothetical protein